MTEIERRRQKRWVAKPGVLLEYRALPRIPWFKGRYRLFGIVMDLSPGGLAVEYPDRKIRLKRVEYALSAPNAGLRLEGIRMEPVSDMVLAEETGCGASACRRRGFRFAALSRPQQEMIDKILRNCTDIPLGE